MNQITEDLCTSLKNGDLNTVKNWLDNGGDLEAKFLGCTALVLSTDVRRHINADVIRLLLDQGANVNVEDSRGWSPLHCVVSNCVESPSHIEVAKWLLDRGANMNLQDKDGKTPLYLAIENRSSAVVRLLLDRGVNVNSQNKIGWSPLHCVVGIDDKSPSNIEFIKWLVDAGADLNMQDNNGNTPLYLALWNRSSIIARLLMDSGASVNVQNQIGWSPLHCVLHNNDNSPSNVEVVKWLVDGGADINMQNNLGKTPLYVAIENRSSDLVRLLLDRGVNVNIKNKIGLSPLHWVASNHDNSPSNLEVIKWLLDGGADINIQDNSGKTPLDLSLEKESCDVVRLLLDNGAYFNLPDKYSCFPLHYVMNNSNWHDFNIHVEVVKSLIIRGSDINLQDNDGNTPLYLALMKKNSAVVTLLLESGANINVQSKSGWSPLHHVLNHCNKFPNYVEIITSFIGRGVDVNTQDDDGNTPLHLALMKRNIAIFELFLDNGANVNIQNNKGWSLLHYVLNQCYRCTINVSHMSRFLIDRGIDVNMQDNDGNTPLHLTFKKLWCQCLYSGHHRRVNLFDRNREDLDDRLSRLRFNNMAIKDKEIVKLLLDTGANVNIQNGDGMTPLHCMSALSENGVQCSDNIIKMIISQTININVQDKEGQTPVHLCVQKLNAKCLSTLLDWGGSIYVENNDGKTPMHYLSEKEDPQLNNCLIRYVQRVRCANLVNDVELPNDHVDDNADSDYKLNLLNELELMKREKVGWSTVHDVFARYQDPLFVNNSDLNAVIESPEFEKKYIIYWQLLKTTFAKAQNRKVLLDKAVNCFEIPIPVEARRMILSCLDCSDILSLLTSYEQAQD